MHLTVNSLTRECVNNGTSKVHRNFLRNNGERNKEKNSTISILLFITLLILWIYDYKDCANREQKNVFLCRGAANLRNHSIAKQQKTA